MASIARPMFKNDDRRRQAGTTGRQDRSANRCHRESLVRRIYLHLVCVLHEPAALPGGFAPGSLGHETGKLCGVEVAPNPLTSCIFDAFLACRSLRERGGHHRAVGAAGGRVRRRRAGLRLRRGGAYLRAGADPLLVAAITFARLILLRIGDGPST